MPTPEEKQLKPVAGSSPVPCSQSAIRPTAAECKQAWDWLKNLAMEENQRALHVLLEWEYQRREAKRLTEELEYIGNSGLSARHLSDLANKAVSSANDEPIHGEKNT